MTASKPDAWIPIYMGDFLSSTGRLAGDEKWSYMLLIWEYWKLGHKGEKLKNDKKTLKNIAQISSKKLDKILAFFQVKDGCLFHPRIEKEIAKAKETKEKNAKKTAAATAARKAKNEERNDQRNVAGNDDPTTTTTTLKDKESFSESKAHTPDFKDLKFQGEFASAAAASKLEGDAATRCWEKFKIYYDSRPPQNPLTAWQKWVIDERQPAAPTAQSGEAAKPLEGRDLLIHQVGLANWKRRRDMTLTGEEKRTLEGWEKDSGVVTWINLDDYRRQQAKPPT